MILVVVVLAIVADVVVVDMVFIFPFVFLRLHFIELLIRYLSLVGVVV